MSWIAFEDSPVPPSSSYTLTPAIEGVTNFTGSCGSRASGEKLQLATQQEIPPSRPNAPPYYPTHPRNWLNTEDSIGPIPLL